MNNTNAALSVGAAIAALWLFRTMRSGKNPVPSVTTSEGFDLSPYGGPVQYPSSIVSLARAIAKAEGFYIKGSIPQRANNPGDIKLPGWSGETLGEGITVFPSADAGWTQLYKQLYLILTGRSTRYTLDDTIAQMARTWTGGDQSGSWANTVASYLGAHTSDPLWKVLA